MGCMAQRVRPSNRVPLHVGHGHGRGGGTHTHSHTTPRFERVLYNCKPVRGHRRQGDTRLTSKGIRMRLPPCNPWGGTHMNYL